MALPLQFCRLHGIAATSTAGGLHLLLSPRTGTAAIAEIARYHPIAAITRVTLEAVERELTQQFSQGAHTAAAVVTEVEGEADLQRLMQGLPQVADLLDGAHDAPIIRMLNALITQAARDGASDIHIEPYADTSAVRFRVDGTLRDVVRPHKGLHAALVSRVKILADLDIAEKRLPQDGRIGLRLGGRGLDVRVSTIPCAYGERVVLRLLDKGQARLGMKALGMADDTLATFRRLVTLPNGIVLVTGPTGSGKTTTLYAALQEVDTAKLNVLTVEDPVEYELPGVGQTQVNPRIDLTFARALRSILRQDPDVVMIGEIRDAETAQIAIQASLTGHLVLATLHTNDAPAAVTRLIDMGIEPFLLASSLRGVLAQRLVRCLCTTCKKVHGRGTWAAPGCDACGMSGFAGRTGVFELLEVDAACRAAIHQRVAESQLRERATAQGMRPLQGDGQRLLQAGVTSAEELAFATRSE